MCTEGLFPFLMFWKRKTRLTLKTSSVSEFWFPLITNWPTRTGVSVASNEATVHFSPLWGLCGGPDSRRTAGPATRNKFLTSGVGVRQVGRLMIGERLKGRRARTSGKEVGRNRRGTRRGRFNDAHAAGPKSDAEGSEVRATHFGSSKSHGNEIYITRLP